MATVTLTSAQNQCNGNGKGNGKCNGTGKGASYVDANKDGVCDYAGTKSGKATAQKGTKNANNKGISKK